MSLKGELKLMFSKRRKEPKLPQKIKFKNKQGKEVILRLKTHKKGRVRTKRLA
jgi:hypothetical protein